MTVLALPALDAAHLPRSDGDAIEAGVTQRGQTPMRHEPPSELPVIASRDAEGSGPFASREAIRATHLTSSAADSTIRATNLIARMETC